MREPEQMRRAGRKLAAILCTSLLAACIGPGLEPPLRPSTAQNSAGTGAAAAENDTPSKSGAAAQGATPPATTAPPTTAPVMPTTPGADGAQEQPPKPGREVDAGTDDSGVTP